MGMRNMPHGEETGKGRRRKLADKAMINTFARKWRAKVLERNHDIGKDAFAEECDDLGFHMDCGESFSKAFPDIDSVISMVLKKSLRE